MVKGKIFVLGVLFSVFLSCVCFAETNEEEIFRVVYDNLAAMEEENLVDYMDTISEDSPGYNTTKQQLLILFNNYDLDYEIESIELLESSANEAKVKVIQSTRKIEGPEFRNNKIVGIHTLEKTDGGWKIYSTEIRNIEYLD
ncbi:MAG: hypothetical protein GF375_02085 [Candidatus Omnitrophica bacterium]|nr:hypothetical protein [Candidatus Omnitrophota bacterium]MBD3268903.1 hypothetical protein [Candidatus Omnitrophota bacterium]